MLNTLNEIESHLNHITDPTHQKMTLTNCSSKQFVDAHNNTCDALHTMLNAQRIMLAYLKVHEYDAAAPNYPRKQAAALVAEGERYLTEVDKGLAKEPTAIVDEAGTKEWTEFNKRISTLTPQRDGQTISYGLPHIDTEADAMQLLMKCGYLCRCVAPVPFIKTFPAWCTACRRIVPFDPDEREEPTR